MLMYVGTSTQNTRNIAFHEIFVLCPYYIRAIRISVTIHMFVQCVGSLPWALAAGVKMTTQWESWKLSDLEYLELGVWLFSMANMRNAHLLAAANTVWGLRKSNSFGDESLVALNAACSLFSLSCMFQEYTAALCCAWYVSHCFSTFPASKVSSMQITSQRQALNSSPRAAAQASAPFIVCWADSI